MSISFNEKDFNLIKIRGEAKLHNLTTKHEYRIYGLRQDDNPPILFSAQENLISEAMEKTLTGFLKTNGIASETEDSDTGNRKIYIGLRYDLRERPLLCAALLNTFIYFCEGRLDLEADFKIRCAKGIPKFVSNVPTKKDEKKS